jgi:Fic family protein
MAYFPPKLPLSKELETKPVLKQLALAHRMLAELKGVAITMPNEQILITTLTLQEAKDSSEIENIFTTQDDLFKADILEETYRSSATKEVRNYANALKMGFEQVRKDKILHINNILLIQEELERNRAGFRKLPGTSLKNANTGEVVYLPPQHHDQVVDLMKNLELFINDDVLSELDPLIKMAIIHHQFESIHPFYDGNGRTGRIINILYLVCKDLLDLPILYLSRYIVREKTNYYKFLQAVRDHDDWESWILFMLKGVEVTAQQTIQLVKDIKALMQQYKEQMRKELPKIYSQDLLNILFKHPYTKIEFVMKEMMIQRITAAKYLDSLVEKGLLQKTKLGRSNYYLNTQLIKLFQEN